MNVEDAFMNTYSNLKSKMKAEEFIYSHLFNNYLVPPRWL